MNDTLTPSLQARLQDRCFAEELRRNAEGYWTDRRCTRDAQHQGGHEFGPWHPLRGGDFPLDGSHAEIAQLKAELKKAVNMARHNYQSAVHEQSHAYEHGHDPCKDYPPLVDDEFASIVDERDAANKAAASWRDQLAVAKVEIRKLRGEAQS